ncbi:hypothetical protein PQO03_20860 [Lentisphaera profundi]|uniref:Uncharacterized protein n=1 Tax=Lentisphaera profundi TaxID=1658616 RepID=A0ABY7VVL4_9BACT|nr:hypothetical protein [Lentisphaera profundi]WDE98270.1 hypothetical protein PQO03_20860 [Lentisphaera profundi]
MHLAYVLTTHKKLLYNFKTQEAEALLNQALVYHPNNKSLIRLAAISHLSNLNYTMAAWKLSALDPTFKPIHTLSRSMGRDSKTVNISNLTKVYSFLNEQNADLAMANMSYQLRNKLNTVDKEILFNTLMKQLNHYVKTIDIKQGKLSIKGSSPIVDFSPLPLIIFTEIDISKIGTDDINEVIFCAPKALKINVLTYSKFSEDLKTIKYSIVK